MKGVNLHLIKSFVAILADAQNGVKDPLNITVEAGDNNIAQVRITGTIQEWSRASADEVEFQIADLVKGGYKDAHIHINTKGGSTLEAVSIVNTLRKGFTGKLIAVGGAIVASAGSYIACKCDEFIVAANTQFMYHRPRMILSGTIDEIKASLKLGENTEKDYIDTYANKTGKTADAIVEAWSKGDVWLMGQEIITEKFADKLAEKEVPITKADAIILEACAAPVVLAVTTEINNSNKISKMEKSMLINALGLTADATDAQIEQAVKDAKSKADRVADLESKATIEAEAKATKLIDDLVEAAISRKAITADQKETYVKLATADFDSAKLALDAIKCAVKPEVNATSSNSAENKDNWTFADYQEKDPAAYLELLESDAAKAELLEKKHYNS